MIRVSTRSDYDPRLVKKNFKSRVRVSVRVRARIMELWNTVTDPGNTLTDR